MGSKIILTGPVGLAMYMYTMFVFTSMIFFIAEADAYLPSQVTDLFIAQRINGATEGMQSSSTEGDVDASSSILTNIALLSPFMFQHLIMARPWFKKAITAIIPEALERGVFCIGSAGSLHYMMVHWIPIPKVVMAVHPHLHGYLMIAHGMGWAVLLASTFMIDHFDLFGVRQAFTSTSEDIVPTFVLSGFYKLVRHPIMTGFLMAFWLHPVFTVGRLAFSTVLTAYIYFVVYTFEEPGLVDMFGDEYNEYIKKVPAFCPRFGAIATANCSPKKSN